MLEILLGIYAIYTLLELVLHCLELGFVKKRMSGEAVILSKQQFIASANASIAKLKFKLFSLCYAFLLLVFWLFWGLGALRQLLEVSVDLSGILAQMLYFSLFLVVSELLSLPLEIYEKFVLDKKLGFSNIKAPLFISDFIKKLVLVAIFAALGAGLFMLCYDFLGTLWWLWAWALAFGIILLVNLIYPTIIAPIFNKTKPLENSELKASIESLLDSCGFKSSGVFIMDASKRDNRLNAYFGGLGASKRVVLFDTLINKLSQAEIIAVLAHELGHFKHKDIIKNIVFMGVMLFVFFGILGALDANIAGVASGEAAFTAKQDAEKFKDNLKQAINHWFSAQMIITKVREGIHQAWTDIQGLDKAMTNIAVVTDMSVSDLWGKIDEYMAIAQEYGVTTQGVYEVS